MQCLRRCSGLYGYLMTPVDVALSAARRAGAIIADGRGVLLEVAHKGAIDMVTQVDLAAEAAIREELTRHTPEIPILAEEGGGAWSSETRWIRIRWMEPPILSTDIPAMP